MLVISVELLNGTVRANSADDLALTGDEPTGEWPLSPARLFAALVAGGGTGTSVPSHVGVKGLDLLTAGAPVIFASPSSHVHCTVLKGRYVPIDKRDRGFVQNYPARKAQLIHPGARLVPFAPQLYYVWETLEPTAEQLAALRYRAARVPYLGCSDSPAIVRVSTELPPMSLLAWTPDEDGDVYLPVPDDGFLARLDDHYKTWRKGQPMRRAWLNTPLVGYRDPGVSKEPVNAASTGQALWVRFDRSVSGRQLVHVSETLKAAVLQHYSEIAGGAHAVPEYLHGHLSRRGCDHHSARWVPLPNVGYSHSDGRLHGALIWLPPDASASEVHLVRQALARIDRLVASRRFDVGVSLFDGTRMPWSSNPLRWRGPEKRWVSATPVVHERHTRGRLDLRELSRWCEHAGVPAPQRFRTSPVPLLKGTPSWDRTEVTRNGRLTGRRSFLELQYDQPVEGPIVLGRGRGFGLGLFAPVKEEH